MGLFDDDLDVETEDPSTSAEGDDSPGSRGDETDDEAGASGGDKVAELERKLIAERGTNEDLMVRLARLEGAVSAQPPAPAAASTAHSLESLAEHASGGGKEAFEAAVAYMKQEGGNFRESVVNEMRSNQAQEDTRSELEAILPGVGNPNSKAHKAVLAESARITARRPSITPERAWDLAVVSVAKQVIPTAPGGKDSSDLSRDRRLETSGAAGAARGGDRDPGQAVAMEFTKEDEIQLRKMKPNSRCFSEDPKVRAQGRRAFVALKTRLRDRSTPTGYTRPQFGGGTGS